MSRQPWQREIAKFPDKEILKIKRINDKYYMGNEWLSYVYKKNGLYRLGTLSGGGESQIIVDPSDHLSSDADKGLCEDGSCDREDIAATIHAHPLKDGKYYTRRNYFSSTDIASSSGGKPSDYQRALEGERVVHFLVFPTPRIDGYHNNIRILILEPGAVKEAMAKATPGKDPTAVTDQNKDEYNWEEFQKEMGARGYIGVVDIENTFGKKNDILSAFVVIGIIIAAVGVGSILKSRSKIRSIKLPGEK